MRVGLPGEKNMERIMVFASKAGKIELFLRNINYIDVNIDIIKFTIDKIYKLSIILLEIRPKTLIYLNSPKFS